MTSSLKAKYHILAILTVAVWGTTFISTKILINNGLSPQDDDSAESVPCVAL